MKRVSKSNKLLHLHEQFWSTWGQLGTLAALGDCRDIWGSLERGDTSNIAHIAVSIKASNEPSRILREADVKVTSCPYYNVKLS